MCGIQSPSNSGEVTQRGKEEPRAQEEPSTRMWQAASARYLRSADILSLLIDLCGSGERNDLLVAE